MMLIMIVTEVTKSMKWLFQDVFISMESFRRLETLDSNIYVELRPTQFQ